MQISSQMLTSFDSLIHLQDSQTTCRHHQRPDVFDSLIHLQDSQTRQMWYCFYSLFDSLIHLQDSQTYQLKQARSLEFDSLIHLQDSQTGRTGVCSSAGFDSLIHLQDSQTEEGKAILTPRLIHLFTYKTLKQWVLLFRQKQVWFTYSLTRLSNQYQPFSFINSFDSLIHLQDSQTARNQIPHRVLFDSLIHLQDSQTYGDSYRFIYKFDSLIHLQDSQTRRVHLSYAL